MKYRLSLPCDWLGDVVVLERKPIVSRKMSNILGTTGYAAINGCDRVSLRNQVITEMRTDKSRPTCDQNPH